jgi:hypothetical protein
VGFVLSWGVLGCGSTLTSPDTTNNLPIFTLTNIDINGTFLTDVKVTVTGTLLAEVDWSFPANDIEIFVTDTTCTYTRAREVRQFCTLLGQTSTPAAKPKILTMSIHPAIYRVFVANFGPVGPDSGTLQISLRGH